MEERYDYVDENANKNTDEKKSSAQTISECLMKEGTDREDHG